MIWKISYLTVILLFIGAAKAEAYLDPGTGSMIIQVIVAALVAGGVFWRNILSFFKNIFNKDKKDSEGT